MSAEPLPQVQRPGMLITRLIPNILTLFALCAGLSAVRFALHERWEAAVAAICIAAIFDMMDGRVARLLRITSKFGAELDSLADLISFGFAPAFILYRWALSQQDQLGWLAVLAYVICAALRLARFNTMLEDTTLPPWRKNFFVGMPSPGAAGLALLPMVWSFSLENEALREPVSLACWLMILAGMMVSRMPIFALKAARMPRSWIVPFFVLLAVIVAQLVTNPWRTIGWLGIVYMLAMPYAWYSYYRHARKQEQP